MSKDSNRLEALREAAVDLRYLLNRGYRKESALKLVGDKYQLNKTERLILYRSIYSKSEAESIKKKMLTPDMLTDKDVWIDGFNVLNTVEAALRRELLILCDDGVVRDFSQVYGSYKISQYTMSSISMMMEELKNLEASNVIILYDSQVSKSGIIAAKTRETMWSLGLRGDAEAVKKVDSTLSRIDAVVCTSDSVILLACKQFFDLAGYIAINKIGRTDIVML